MHMLASYSDALNLDSHSMRRLSDLQSPSKLGSPWTLPMAVTQKHPEPSFQNSAAATALAESYKCGCRACMHTATLETKHQGKLHSLDTIKSCSCNLFGFFSLPTGWHSQSRKQEQHLSNPVLVQVSQAREVPCRATCRCWNPKPQSHSSLCTLCICTYDISFLGILSFSLLSFCVSVVAATWITKEGTVRENAPRSAILSIPKTSQSGKGGHEKQGGAHSLVPDGEPAAGGWEEAVNASCRTNTG